jgi:hypothetical protein
LKEGKNAMITLTTPAIEKSVYWITVNYVDEQNNAIAPDVATWTLTDLEGNVINSREDVAIAAPVSSETIELSGNDLAVDGNDMVQRILTIEGTYTSAVYGAGKPLKIQIKFPIEPVIIV